MSLLYLARSSPLPEETRGMLDEIDHQLLRGGQITKQMLGFYRETGAPETARVSHILD